MHKIPKKHAIATLVVTLSVVAAVAVVRSFKPSAPAKSPTPNYDAYRFEELVELPTTSVKVQGMSGTCWSFAGTSFLESELLRLTGKEHDLSEMFPVRNAYHEKARNYILRQGTARFTEGGLIHDVLISAAKHGIATDDYYSGLVGDKTVHDHRELISELEGIVKSHTGPHRNPGTGWEDQLEEALDKHLGNVRPDSRGGDPFDPQEFLASSPLNIDDYITLTSFDHAPFYKPFVLEIPANFASERFYNLPIDELIRNIDSALERGFTLALDSDCTEPCFGNGVAVLPAEGTTHEQVTQGEFAEKEVTQAARQSEFESFRTTDDHLMHVVGKAGDQFGRRYYKVKNCWGVEWGRDGFTYLSEAYLKMKVISVTLHKDGLTASTRTSVGL